MKYLLLVLLACSFASAAQKPVVKKILKPDTTITTKQDTSITIDTLKVTEMVLDTSYVVKRDTAICKPVPGKIVSVKPIQKK